MESLRELFISLGLEADTAAFAEAGLLVDGLEKAAELLVETLKEIPKFLMESVEATAEYAHGVEMATLRTGLSAESFQEWAYAAQVSGSSAETLETAFTRLAHKMSMVTEGNSEAALAFQRLGVRVTDGNGHLRDREAVMLDVADAIARTENPTEKAALAFGVLDRSSVSLIPLMSKGSKGFREMAQEAHDFGGVMDGEAIESAAHFQHGLEALHLFIESLKRDFGGPLIEALTPLLEGFKEWVKTNRAIIRSGIEKFVHALAAVGKVLLTVFKGLVAVGKFIAAAWKSLAVIIGSYLVTQFILMNAALLEQLTAWVLNTAAAIAYGAISVATALKAAAAWLAAAAPIILITALLALGVLVLNDIWHALNGHRSMLLVLGPLWTNWLDSLMKVDPKDPAWLRWLKEALRTVLDLEGHSDFLRFVFGHGKANTTVTPEQAAQMSAANAAAIANQVALHRGPGLAPHDQGLADYWQMGGGAASPAASAASKPVGPQILTRPVSSPTFNIYPTPGMSAGDVANEVQRKLDEHHQTILTQTADALPGG